MESKLTSAAKKHAFKVKNLFKGTWHAQMCKVLIKLVFEKGRLDFLTTKNIKNASRIYNYFQEECLNQYLNIKL